MNLKYCVNICVLFTTLLVFGQENLYTSLTIPSGLKADANAVIRLNEVSIIIESETEMHIQGRRIITVMNSAGERHIGANVPYDPNTKIKDLKVSVFDARGNLIDKIKENDFKDVSAVEGGTLYSDSRVKYLEYTAIKYPYTIEFTYDVVDENTAFIKSFVPVNSYLLSAETCRYTITYPSDLNIKTKAKNFDGISLEKEEKPGEIHFEAKNIKAFKYEDFSPGLFDIAPMVLVRSTEFQLEGVQTKVENWNDFGKWMYHDLIKDTHDLPEATKNKIRELVKDEPNDRAKAKKIYEYVQNKTRYIGVQVGIGGWKPFNASEVDALGYGDCKGLTNYTLALLDAVGIKSNYTVVYAKSSQRNFEHDFASMQGNHAILNIPMEGEDVWLECTSQKLPFGFIGDFTDDRDVLVITSEGAQIKRTKKYTVEENLQTIKAQYEVLSDGGIQAQLKVVSKGIQYDDKYSLEVETQRELDKAYKERWSYINRLAIENIHIENNKTDIEFIEAISFQAGGYAKKIGDRMLLTLNAVNRNTYIPDRYRNRKWPLKVSRGFKDVDEIEIKLPEGYQIEAKPENILIENKFGSYKALLETKDEKTLVYKREFTIVDGEFPKEDYSAFRDFHKKVAQLDNSKIALIKTTP
ncbi:DUF3857 domain-containing transglutaminase family protein [Tamlana haliotis]|uniref:DUF3857 domain-containing transglutaminase family protein n=1 Tax=Pseudotamlana haliotis TaxID=2614804 RepID=A0A6N6MCW6_9FLAO|nr:DUF3857 domain-containing protein [Tamlana haliotis]KAB1068461.1 DUF3857 domain-containing transglutaminase family protein [Tamlana haliotis]